MKLIDKLINRIIQTKNPSVIGLDPDISKIPRCYKKAETNENMHPFSAVSDMIIRYNMDIIDTIADIVPAVKSQSAFYEKYGSFGWKALENTIAYAKSKGLIVIEDAKRNDIGNTAKAYAEGHLGKVEALNGELVEGMGTDFLTVSPFLGSESLKPFVDICTCNDKGIFILVKTSNSSSGEIQNVINDDGHTISEKIAEYISAQAKNYIGHYGYSSIGAVVGATYPKEAQTLRMIMAESFFLVPGYGAQGGGAKDIISCFDNNGLGAVVNSSRGILYGCMSDRERNSCEKEEYLFNVRNAAVEMKKEIYKELCEKCSSMIY